METGMDKRAKMVACFDNQIDKWAYPGKSSKLQHCTRIQDSGIHIWRRGSIASSSEELEGTTRLT
ncbi:hypothetical protein NC651_029461 [Populus alba x Populus x berolinensis]|nr:hypothetical protein NC651_029461 [Populus alba x Populus x berolinensis]